MNPSIRIRATGLRFSIGVSLLVVALPVGARSAHLHGKAESVIVRTPSAHGRAGVQQDARAQVEAARRTLQQLQRAAQAAGTAEFADVADLMSEAHGRARAAQTAFEGGDFSAALTDFEAAVQTIRRAVAATAAAATAARQQAEASGRGALEAVEAAAAQIERGRNLERRGRFNDGRLAYLEATLMYERATGANPERVLLAVLERYEAAMESEDIAAYRALWVNISPNVERNVADSFEQFESWQIEYSETEVMAQSEETATLEAIQSLRFVDASTGNTVEANTRVTFALRKSADRWLIETLTQTSIQ